MTRRPPISTLFPYTTLFRSVVVRPDTSSDRLSPESNVQSMKVDETFFNGLPLDVDYLLPFIDTFTSAAAQGHEGTSIDRKSTRLNSSHTVISYAVFCLKKKT